MTAPGHMAHPFDCPDVETGQDLESIFNSIAKYLKSNSAAVKIDGVNVSFKLVDTPNGKQFAADRGSLKPIDISGITIDKVADRFPEGHGMIDKISVVLAILNNSLPSVEKELKELGMWDDSTIFMNTEAVDSGQTNVMEYEDSFLAIHGLNKFYEKTHSRSGITRPGSVKPEGVTSPSHEIEYSDNAMKRFIKKLNPAAEKYNMRVVGSIPTETVEDINFSNTLSSRIRINITDEDFEEKSLSSWLKEVVNPRNAFVSLSDGKKVKAISKHIYTELIANQAPVANILKNGSDVAYAINGAIFWHATRQLGNDVLNSVTSDLGQGKNQEGIVIRDKHICGGTPVKVTGDFIVKGMESKFGKNEIIVKEEEQEEKTVVPTGKITVLFPGGFKPPHAGHLEIVKRYLDDPDVGDINIFIGPHQRPKIDSGVEVSVGEEESLKIWNIYLNSLPGSERVNLVQLSNMSNLENVPLRAAYQWAEKNSSPGDIYALATSSKKQRGANRSADFENYFTSGRGKDAADERGFFVRIHPIATRSLRYTGRGDKLDGQPISSTVMRRDAQNGDLGIFSTNIPSEVIGQTDEIMKILNIQIVESFTKKKLYSLVKEIMADYGGGNMVASIGGAGSSVQALANQKIHHASAAPDYRIAGSNENCSNCKHFNKNKSKDFPEEDTCKYYNFKTTERYVCDDWEAITEFSAMGAPGGGAVTGGAVSTNTDKKKKGKKKKLTIFR